MTPLLTSLPPRLSRVGADGQDAGAEYQRSCARSWHAAGFAPVSVNSRGELAAHPDLPRLAQELGVRVVAVDRDASPLTGRAHVFLADLLQAGAQIAAQGAFAIVNADIVLEGDGLGQRVAALAGGEFLAARRMDIADPRARSGHAYPHGFDFFAVRAQDARALPDIGLIVGVPWWDHYFPILLRAQGRRLRLLREPLAFHLEHAERWERRIWRDLGERFLKDVRGVLRSPGCAAEPQAGEYARALAEATRAPWAPWRRPARDEILDRVSLANLAFLGH